MAGIDAVHELYTEIARGREGKNIGLTTGLEKLDGVIHGIQRRCLVSIGGSTGSGKSSLALDVYVFKPLIQLMDKGPGALKIVYYSLELSRRVILAKLLSLYVSYKYNEIITYSEILSFDVPLDDYKNNFLEQAKAWLIRASEFLDIRDAPLTVESFISTQTAYYASFGKFENTESNGQLVTTYTPNDPNMYFISIIDHLGLLGDKSVMDNLIKQVIYYRDTCGGTYVSIQQLNRSQQSIERRKSGQMAETSLSDFKDSGGATEGAEVVIGMYYPYREGIGSCRGYKIIDPTGAKDRCLNSRFRLLIVLKNRFGMSEIGIPSGFYGEIGSFRPLPLPADMTDYDYVKYNNVVSLEPIQIIRDVLHITPKPVVVQDSQEVVDEDTGEVFTALVDKSNEDTNKFIL